MSAINDSGISLAENRTFRAFLALYTVMSILILALMGTIYYRYQKELMLSTHRLSMQLQSESYMPRLQQWLRSGSWDGFPEDLAYETGLYAEDKSSIESLLRADPRLLEQGIRKEGAYIHFVVPLASYGIYGTYLVFETEDDGLWFREFLQNSLIFGIVIFSVLIVIGFFLSKLFIRPMKEAVVLLDNFIKDTTHELNTPVSTILSNIEMLDTNAINESEVKKIRRISIAARTISTIYDDLTYLVLNHKLAYMNEDIDLSSLLKERLEYFRDRYEQKKLTLHMTIDDIVILHIDKTKAIRLIDNLLSNAIKYNRMGGSITILLKPDRFSIQDTGIGIDKEKIDRIFERYMRADNTVGGFGIGLNIVAMIAKEYEYKIEVESTPRKGTSITVFWS
ncbi:MAG: sensor histidine kinase [Epsilonproteobacteria bacterium]|nr:MAG: sensor histidine kinase [Campylobacterota bacterium]